MLDNKTHRIKVKLDTLKDMIFEKGGANFDSKEDWLNHCEKVWNNIFTPVHYQQKYEKEYLNSLNRLFLDQNGRLILKNKENKIV